MHFVLISRILHFADLFIFKKIRFFIVERNKIVRKWPMQGWIGLGLVSIFWILNWSLIGLRTHVLFFPLWLGYCLTMDGLVFLRKGSSPLSRCRTQFVTMFFISMPTWWLFELLNLRTQNWLYLGREYFTDFQYAVLASLSFSTVIPAVFITAEWVNSFIWLKKNRHGPVIGATQTHKIIIFSSGWLMLGLLLIWPDYFFPFLWLSVYFILEPINCWLGNRSLLRFTAEGNWRPILSLWIGCLICAFFWEMWNFYSYPKWIYSVPFVDFFHIFEMPILGYLGYLPFSLELFAIYYLVMGFFRNKSKLDFIQDCSVLEL